MTEGRDILDDYFKKAEFNTEGAIERLSKAHNYFINNSPDIKEILNSIKESLTDLFITELKNNLFFKTFEHEEIRKQFLLSISGNEKDLPKEVVLIKKIDLINDDAGIAEFIIKEGDNLIKYLNPDNGNIKKIRDYKINAEYLIDSFKELMNMLPKKVIPVKIRLNEGITYSFDSGLSPIIEIDYSKTNIKQGTGNYEYTETLQTLSSAYFISNISFSCINEIISFIKNNGFISEYNEQLNSYINLRTELFKGQHQLRKVLMKEQ